MAGDIADQAQRTEALFLKVALSQRAQELPHRGICYNCDEPLPHNAAFCDPDCREDYEKRTRR